MTDLDRLLHEPEVSEITGFSRHTLRGWRSAAHPDNGPKWHKVGRSVVYRESDVKAWMRDLTGSKDLDTRVKDRDE